VTNVQLTLIGKPDCHLCDDAREVVERVRAELAERGIGTDLEEFDILKDEALARKHAESIPVVQINGRRHSIWRVDPDRLSAAVEKASRPRITPWRKHA